MAIPGFQTRSDPAQFAEAEARYLAVREREGRLLQADEVRKLPVTAPDAPHASEWRLRAHSWGVVEHYLERAGVGGSARTPFPVIRVRRG